MTRNISFLALILVGMSLNAQDEKPEREPFQFQVAINSVNYFQ